jgi:Zn-dependent alcohol dehydrogenase
MRTMRAALLEAPGERLKIVADVEIDDPRTGEVLVRVRQCGVCHSDLGIVDGQMPYPMPVILGHEAAGIVEALGDGITDLSVGDRVVLSMRPPCGSCYFCVRDQPVLCVTAGSPATAGTSPVTARVRRKGIGITRGLRLGAFAEYALVERSGVVRIPDTVPLVEAAVVGCAVQTGLGSVINVARVRAGETAAVIGLGGVGLSVVQGLAISGAGTLIGIDPNERRREHAVSLGASATYGTQADLAEQAKALVNGVGFDYVFDGVGSAATMELAGALVRKGGTIVLIGVARSGEPVAIPALDVVFRQLNFMGSFLGNCHPQRDIPRYFDLCCTKRLDLRRLVTRERPFDEINEALDDMRNGVGIRTVLSI